MEHKEISATNAEMIKKLKWREPKHAYVLFRSKHFEVSKEQNPDVPLSPYEGLCTIRVDGCHKTIEKMGQYIRKGFKVITWGNFPTGEDPVMKYYEEDGSDPWKILRGELQVLVGKQRKVDDEMDALKREIAILKSQSKGEKDGKPGQSGSGES